MPATFWHRSSLRTRESSRRVADTCGVRCLVTPYVLFAFVESVLCVGPLPEPGIPRPGVQTCCRPFRSPKVTYSLATEKREREKTTEQLLPLQTSTWPLTQPNSPTRPRIHQVRVHLHPTLPSQRPQSQQFWPPTFIYAGIPLAVHSVPQKMG